MKPRWRAWVSPRRLRCRSGSKRAWWPGPWASPQVLPGHGAVRDASLAFGRALDSARGMANKHPDTSPDAVVARAESRLGELGFDMWLNNCEHFATWCRTGISNSAQVDGLWRMALGPMGYWLHKTSEAVNATLDRPK